MNEFDFELKKLDFLKRGEGLYFDGRYYVNVTKDHWVIKSNEEVIDEGMMVRSHILFQVLKHIKSQQKGCFI
ncbi:hypothetical protein [Paenibacillus pini]|uniref:Uncharacterized protein n=1 Tax=Paenibacillus pini JCM 16418 TaxID=1236976 RepID=W7YU32_9BACL|nr:hypothetical protein [Paenibacillus pini]GAF10718.1 hypothetical protein JCM16418_4937 [Paenibacillus pini JCM 16418]